MSALAQPKRRALRSEVKTISSDTIPSRRMNKFAAKQNHLKVKIYSFSYRQARNNFVYNSRCRVVVGTKCCLRRDVLCARANSLFLNPTRPGALYSPQISTCFFIQPCLETRETHEAR